jgi:uncharacterized protein YndB with AHSA1/START domain
VAKQVRSDGASVASEFLITRDFDAPRELVFEAFSTPEHLTHWWGPVNTTVHIERMDFRPGGVLHYCSRFPDGGELWGKFVYQEIVQPELLVYSSMFADADGNTIRAPFADDFPLELRNRLTFAEDGGVTKLTLLAEPVDPTEAERERFEKFAESMRHGFAGTLDRLDAYLEEIQQSS